MGLAYLTKILQKCQRDLAVIMGTAAHGGSGMNGDEVVEGRSFRVIFGVQRIPCGRVRCADDGFVFGPGTRPLYVVLL